MIASQLSLTQAGLGLEFYISRVQSLWFGLYIQSECEVFMGRFVGLVCGYSL